MALVDNAWYVNYGDGSTTGYYAVALWTALTTYNAGNIVRQRTAPAVGSERCFIAIVGNVASLASEPASWTTTRGGTTAEAASVTWQECTGIAGINGDITNTPNWTTVKNTVITKGQVIKNNAATILLICSTGGTAGNGSEPSWATYTNAGATTADNTATWTNIGVVGNFTGWQAPHARLPNAFASTWGQAGNAFFLGDNTAETTSAGLTLASPGTSAAPCNIYSVDHTAAVPPTAVLTGATLNQTGGANTTYTGTAAYHNVTIFQSNAAGGNQLINNSGATYFYNSILKLGAAVGAQFMLGNSGGSGNVSNKVVLNGCTLTFGQAAQSIGTQQGAVTLNGCTLTGTAPTTLIAQGANANLAGNFRFKGCDLSLVVGTILGATASPISAILSDCKLGAGVTGAAASTVIGGSSLDIIDCDSGATNYRLERCRYEGTQTVETTIVRAGGATDGDTAIAWKIAASSNSKWSFPFESLPIAIRNNSTAAISTLTFYGTTTGGGVPNNDDIWVEVEYLGSGSTPLGSIITSTKASNLAASAATNNSSDASTWGGSGAGNGFKIVVPSFTPAQKGPINIVIKVAKASATYYIDPQPEIAGVPVWRSYALAPGVHVNERMIGRGGLHPIGEGLAA